MACSLHADNPAICPQEHICRCGLPLSEHFSVQANCPDPKRPQRYTNVRGAYHPNDATLERFPEQYR